MTEKKEKKLEFKYFDVPILNISRIYELLNSDIVRDVCVAILSSCNYYEYDFGINVCKQNFNRREKWIKKNILNGLILLVARFEKIDVNLVREIVTLYSKEDDLEIKYGINDLLEDMKHTNVSLKGKITHK